MQMSEYLQVMVLTEQQNSLTAQLLAMTQERDQLLHQLNTAGQQNHEMEAQMNRIELVSVIRIFPDHIF
jgi:hypothetical protein